MIRPSDIAAIEHVVFRSGAADAFRAAINSGRAGRPPRFDRALYLAGMVLTARVHAKTHLRAIHHVLTEELPIDTQVAWGVRRPANPATGAQAWVLTESDLQNVSRRTRDALSPLSQPRARTPLHESEESRRRQAALNAIIDRLLEATLIKRPDRADTYAIDESGLWASDRLRRRHHDQAPDTDHPGSDPDPDPSASTSADDDAPTALASAAASLPDQPRSRERKRRPRIINDARAGVKTRKDGKDEWYYGYAVHALVRVPRSKNQDTRPEPPLAERIRITPAATDVVDVSLELLDAIRDKGQVVRYLLADRHYSYKKSERWLYPLIQRGISQVITLREDDHGFRDWDGMLFVAGHAHCPATPPDLGIIKEPPRDADSADIATFHTRIATREAYACQRTQALDTQGRTRWRCPALNGTVGCPLRPGTVQVARAIGLPIVAQPPEHPPSICTQDSVGLRATTEDQARLLKTYQKHYWGNRKQMALARLRTFVEGWFGTLKGDSAANKNRGSSLYTGLAHATLEAAAFAVAANIINLRAWHKDTGLGDPSHPLLHADPPSYGIRHITEKEYQQVLQGALSTG